MTESEVITATPIKPTDPGYIGCYADMTSDRVLTAALTMADLTPEVRIRGDFGEESFSSGISLMSLRCLLFSGASRTVKDLFRGENEGKMLCLLLRQPVAWQRPYGDVINTDAPLFVRQNGGQTKMQRDSLYHLLVLCPPSPWVIPLMTGMLCGLRRNGKHLLLSSAGRRVSTSKL